MLRWLRNHFRVAIANPMAPMLQSLVPTTRIDAKKMACAACERTANRVESKRLKASQGQALVRTLQVAEAPSVDERSLRREDIVYIEDASSYVPEHGVTLGTLSECVTYKNRYDSIGVASIVQDIPIAIPRRPEPVAVRDARPCGGGARDPPGAPQHPASEP